jgi:hypothetical protein
MNKTKSDLHIFSKKSLNIHRTFVAVESTTLIFFIFLPSKIRVSLAGVVSSIFPPWYHLSSDRRHHATAPCRASFSLSQDELAVSASSSSNDSSRRIPSRTKTEALNLRYHRRPPSSDHPTPILHCYENVISVLTTLTITQSHLHFVSSLARASRHRRSTFHRHSLSLPSHTYRLSTQ